MLDKERNISLANEIVEKFNPIMPEGLTLYTTKEAFGVSYKHPRNAPGSTTGVQISFCEPKDKFDKDCNDACEKIHRMAKHMNTKYGVPLAKSSRVIECEKSMVDGRCQCGYSVEASESALALRNMVKATQHTGYEVKGLKSRLNEEGDVIW